MREILLVVRTFVNKPDEVRVVIRSGETSVIAELFTHPADIPLVIGRNGHVVGSIRSLLSAVAGKYHVDFHFTYVTEMMNRRREREKRRAIAHPVESVS